MGLEFYAASKRRYLPASIYDGTANREKTVRIYFPEYTGKNLDSTDPEWTDHERLATLKDPEEVRLRFGAYSPPNRTELARRFTPNACGRFTDNHERTGSLSDGYPVFRCKPGKTGFTEACTGYEVAGYLIPDGGPGDDFGGGQCDIGNVRPCDFTPSMKWIMTPA